MSEQKEPVIFLYDAYVDALSSVRSNRAKIKELQEKNRSSQVDLALARENLTEILKILIKEEGSLYKVFQKYFGKIDKRYYRVCSMITKHL